jgi:hypothetical protein
MHILPVSSEIAKAFFLGCQATEQGLAGRPREEAGTTAEAMIVGFEVVEMSHTLNSPLLLPVTTYIPA